VPASFRRSSTGDAVESSYRVHCQVVERLNSDLPPSPVSLICNSRRLRATRDRDSQGPPKAWWQWSKKRSPKLPSKRRRQSGQAPSRSAQRGLARLSVQLRMAWGKTSRRVIESHYLCRLRGGAGAAAAARRPSGGLLENPVTVLGALSIRRHGRDATSRPERRACLAYMKLLEAEPHRFASSVACRHASAA
jgi:hypothetical protein